MDMGETPIYNNKILLIYIDTHILIDKVGHFITKKWRNLFKIILESNKYSSTYNVFWQDSTAIYENMLHINIFLLYRKALDWKENWRNQVLMNTLSSLL